VPLSDPEVVVEMAQHRLASPTKREVSYRCWPLRRDAIFPAGKCQSNPPMLGKEIKVQPKSIGSLWH
jgi:hypothetical protein